MEVVRLGRQYGAVSQSGQHHLKPSFDDRRREFETNFYGPLQVTREFVPILEANGRGHILTMHSVLSWLTFPGVEAYAASKAALWSQTNSLRLALHPRGIRVTGLHVAYTDTDMVASVDAPKNPPELVARCALDGIEADAVEVLVDDLTRQVKAGLAADPSIMYPEIATPSAATSD